MADGFAAVSLARSDVRGTVAGAGDTIGFASACVRVFSVRGSRLVMSVVCRGRYDPTNSTAPMTHTTAMAIPPGAIPSVSPVDFFRRAGFVTGAGLFTTFDFDLDFDFDFIRGIDVLQLKHLRRLED
jgi:hypothetical protein